MTNKKSRPVACEAGCIQPFCFPREGPRQRHGRRESGACGPNEDKRKGGREAGKAVKALMTKESGQQKGRPALARGNGKNDDKPNIIKFIIPAILVVGKYGFGELVLPLFLVWAISGRWQLLALTAVCSLIGCWCEHELEGVK